MKAIIGTPAPNFKSIALMPNGDVNYDFELNNYITGHIGVVFFYSLDYSPVCASELVELAIKMESFETRGVRVVAVSTDSHLSHAAWQNMPFDKGGIGKMPYPIVTDMTRTISENYGVLVDNSMSLRGTFIIDADGFLRHQSTNDFPVGRNIDEIIRFIDAFNYYIETGNSCPAGWTPGSRAIDYEDENGAKYLMENYAENPA